MILTAISDRDLEIKYSISDYAHNPSQTYKMNNQMYLSKERTINFCFLGEECTHMSL